MVEAVNTLCGMGRDTGMVTDTGTMGMETGRYKDGIYTGTVTGTEMGTRMG